MKSNQFVVLYVLVSGILIGAAISAVVMTSESYVSGKTSVESVYDARFHGFEWRGHKYLKYGGSTNPSVLHDPDCPCKTNKVEVTQ